MYNNKNSKYFLALASIALLSGCNGGTTSSQNTVAENNALWTKTKALRQADTENLRPGRGYNSLTGTLAPASCFTPDNIISSAVSGDSSFKLDKDMISHLTSLKEQFTGSYKSPVYSGSADLKFLKEVNNNRLGISYVFHTVINRNVNMTYGYGTSILSPTGRAIYQDGNNPDFAKLCGDTLIKSFSEEGELLVAFTFTFDSYEQKQTFASEVSGKYTNGIGKLQTIGEVKNIFELAQEDSHAHVSLNVTATQNGGMAQNLMQVVPSFGISCGANGKNDSSCDMLFSSLSNYSGNFASQFGQQMPDQDGTYASRNMEFTGQFVATQKLSDVGITAPTLSYPPELTEIRKQLDDKYKEETQYIYAINNILNNYPIDYEWRFQELLVNTKAEIESQINTFQTNNADICWTNSASESDIATCKADAEAILNTPIPLDKLSEINAGVAKMLVINVSKNTNEQIDLYPNPATGQYAAAISDERQITRTLRDYEQYSVSTYLPESDGIPARIVGHYQAAADYAPKDANFCFNGKYKIYLGSLNGPDYPTIYRACAASSVTTKLHDYHETPTAFAFLSQKTPPNGSWKASCNQNRVYYDGYTLSAFCLNTSGNYVHTQAKVSSNGGCDNSNGTLSCYNN